MNSFGLYFGVCTYLPLDPVAMAIVLTFPKPFNPHHSGGNKFCLIPDFSIAKKIMLHISTPNSHCLISFDLTSSIRVSGKICLRFFRKRHFGEAMSRQGKISKCSKAPRMYSFEENANKICQRTQN